MTSTAFTKTVRLGTVAVGKRNASVFASIKFDGANLSICGVEGPLASGNCLGGCGQIGQSMKAADVKALAPGWSRAKVAEFLRVWRRWHLNDMHAGSPRQREFVRGLADRSYIAANNELNKAGLNPDPEFLHNGEPYAYGSAWLREEIPAEVVAFLSGLPDTDRAPAWV